MYRDYIFHRHCKCAYNA
jgi:hypothetical protein